MLLKINTNVLVRLMSLLIIYITSCSHLPHEHSKTNHSKHHRFQDAQKWSKRFDDPKRIQWQKPKEIIRLMAIKPKMMVAEIGSGTGYMLPYLNQTVSQGGQVFALDIEANLIHFMKKRVVREKLDHVIVKQISPTSPELSNLSISRVLLVNTWHHMSNRKQYATLLFQQTTKDAEVLIVEPEPGKGGPGPKDSHRMSTKSAMNDFKTSGFKCDLMEETLPYQYILHCKKAD